MARSSRVTKRPICADCGMKSVRSAGWKASCAHRSSTLVRGPLDISRLGCTGAFPREHIQWLGKLLGLACRLIRASNALLPKQRLRLFCPNTQLIAAGISEMEPATAWKVIRTIHYSPTRTDDRFDARI